MSEVQVVPAGPTQSMVTVRLSDIQIHPEMIDLPRSPSPHSSILTRSSRSTSISEADTSSIDSVNWESLDKTEEEEAKADGTDESTALLLARLEQENAALAEDPKSSLHRRKKSATRPPSIHHLKNLVNGPQRQSLRYSLLPAPPMTELEFWAALVSDYTQTAQRLPTLTSNKIRTGIPPPLRGVVWPSVAGARDPKLHQEYLRLSKERSPFEGLIAKDVGRSFPHVDMFKERDGEGQRMLGNVLKAFSLYDEKIGYCQGLGFVVGPLLMHMTEPEAFSILVRLMEHYDLRSCYLPDLSGLHLRIYQYQALHKKHLPELAAHLESLKIEPVYVSQWFLSFFAVTCPLPMLLRIYDVILAEGATETLMRVALSLMQRNEAKLRALTEFEDAMQFLLSRGLWEAYAQNADELINSFVALTSLVTPESLQALEKEFTEAKALTPTASLKPATTSLLGRFWAGSAHSISKSASNLSLIIPGSSLRKSSSGQSLTSTVISVETVSDGSTVAIEASEQAAKPVSKGHNIDRTSDSSKTNDKDLHHQIEELLTALSEMQRQQIDMARELQRERDERAEDREIAKSLLESLRSQSSAIQELAGGDLTEDDMVLEGLITNAETHFAIADTKRMSIVQSKRQLRDVAADWKEKHDAEQARCQELMRQLDEREQEQAALKDNLREARSRILDAHREKQKLERTVQELRLRKPSLPDSPSDLYSPISENADGRGFTARSGLRELKLGKPDSGTSTSFGKRSSSLNTQAVFATENHQLVSDEALLIELVNAKTAEAVARQELEETKGKLDALRKIISGPISTPVRTPPSDVPTPESPTSDGGTPKAIAEKVAAESNSNAHIKATSTSGGFFSGWGRRGT